MHDLLNILLYKHNGLSFGHNSLNLKRQQKAYIKAAVLNCLLYTEIHPELVLNANVSGSEYG